MRVRALTDDEWRALRLGRLVAAEVQPYLMHALFAVVPVAAEGLGTFAVDGEWRLYLDPGRLVEWDSATVAGVLLHEVGHLLRDHAGRSAQLPPPVHRLAWNLAGDAEINDDLLAAGVPLPAGVVTPSALGVEAGGLAETYYRHLVGTALPDDGGFGCGSGAGCDPVPGEVGVARVSGVALSGAEADLVRRQVAAAVRSASGSGRGDVPGGLVRWASEVLAPPVLAWDRLLRGAVRGAVGDCAGRVDYTYRRPSRRRWPGLVLPAMCARRVRAALVVDTSGSMAEADLDAAMSEVRGVLHATGVSREHVTVLSCDARAGAAVRVRGGGPRRLQGGGGTDMRVGIAAAEAGRPAPDLVVVFTDGWTPWPDRPTRSRLLVVVVGAHGTTEGVPSWAMCVRVDS